MGLIQTWRNQKLRESVRYPNLAAFKLSLEQGGDPMQEVLDPTGGPGSMTPLLHAIMDWPTDGLGAYQKHWVNGEAAVPRDMFFLPRVLGMNEPSMERDPDLRKMLTTPAETYRAFIAHAVSQGVAVQRPDSRGRTLSSIALQHGREDWLAPTPVQSVRATA